MSKHLILIAIAAMLGRPGVAAADDAKATAQAHVTRATELHERGEFAAALDELKTAYALDPRPPLLFAMGQLHVQLGECGQAITFYERFLATRPERDQAALAREAITTCKTAPPPAVEPPAPAPAPAPVVEVAPSAPPAVSPPEVTAAPAAVAVRSPARPWYTNYVADGLVGGGLVTGVAALVVYRGATADRERAERASDYDGYAALIERAHGKRTSALMLGVGGAALATAGGLLFLLVDREAPAEGLQVAPRGDGGVVSWSGRF